MEEDIYRNVCVWDNMNRDLKLMTKIYKHSSYHRDDILIYLLRRNLITNRSVRFRVEYYVDK